MLTPRLAILDRDGVINVERHYLSRPNQVELIPNAAEGLRILRELGLKTVVVTNQSAINRGFFDCRTLERIHARLVQLLAARGAVLDAIYFCPHRPEEGCRCRKPGVELLEKALHDFSIDPGQAVVIGDKASDLEAGRRIGAPTILVKSGYGLLTLQEHAWLADWVVDDLVEAANVVARPWTLAPANQARITSQ